MASKRPVTDHLTRWLIQHVGIRETVFVLDIVASWGIARRKLGPGMTIEEYGEYWALSRSQAFRHQARFRAAFEDRYPTPDPVCDALEDEWPAVFKDKDPKVVADQLARVTT